MKKKSVVLSVVLCLANSFVCGVWKVGTITNSSDLVLESAFYEKPTLTTIPYLTAKLQESKKLQKPVTVAFNYTVAQTANGHSIVKAQDGYQLIFDDNLTHFIKSGRSKVKRKCVSKKLGIHKKYRHIAQVFLELSSKIDGSSKDITCAIYGYDQDDAIFNLALSGSAGNYTIALQPA